MQRVAARHGITVAQVYLAWVLQRGTKVVVKSASPERQQDNWESSTTTTTTTTTNNNAADGRGITLSEEEMREIEGLERSHRFFRPDEWWGGRHGNDSLRLKDTTIGAVAS